MALLYTLEYLNSSDSSPVPYATHKEKCLNGLLHGKKWSRREILPLHSSQEEVDQPLQARVPNQEILFVKTKLWRARRANKQIGER